MKFKLFLWPGASKCSVISCLPWVSLPSLPYPFLPTYYLDILEMGLCEIKVK